MVACDVGQSRISHPTRRSALGRCAGTLVTIDLNPEPRIAGSRLRVPLGLQPIGILAGGRRCPQLLTIGYQ
jgi:hypothetical protein